MAIEWQPSRLGETYTATLAKTLTLSVTREVQSRGNPSPTPYSATVFGSRLNARWATVEEAQDAAVRVARHQLERATLALG